MKKTLTVNLGGTVFNIDDDAYRLLDNYLSNLKIHFRKEAGADEIVDDIERRISELFAEKLSAGSQVITIADVEEVIARMGKPEDMETEGESSSADAGSTNAGGGYGAGAWSSNTAYSTTRRRLYRNPDDKMLGGVISGMAAYLGWDVTLLRLLLLVVLICGVGTLIPVYIVCWLIIPEARTAAEKLSMRGEAVTVENIGKTVTDGFEKVANGVNDYMRSDKPRTFLQKLGDTLVMVVGWLLKICLVIFAIICSPILFVFGVVFVALLFAAIAVAVGGGAALISLFPMADVVLPTSPLSAIVMYIAGILLGHGLTCAGTDGDQQGVGVVTELLAGDFFQTLEVLKDVSSDFVIDLTAVCIILGAGVGGDGEALRHRHTGCGHLGQTGTLAAQRVLHGDLVTAESIIAFAEVVQILFAHALFTSHS